MPRARSGRRGPHLGVVGVGDLGDHFAGGGIGDGVQGPAGGHLPLAVDEERELAGLRVSVAVMSFSYEIRFDDGARWRQRVVNGSGNEKSDEPGVIV